MIFQSRVSRHVMELLCPGSTMPKVFSPTVIIRDGKGCTGPCRTLPSWTAKLSGKTHASSGHDTVLEYYKNENGCLPGSVPATDPGSTEPMDLSRQKVKMLTQNIWCKTYIGGTSGSDEEKVCWNSPGRTFTSEMETKSSNVHAAGPLLYAQLGSQDLQQDGLYKNKKLFQCQMRSDVFRHKVACPHSCHGAGDGPTPWSEQHDHEVSPFSAAKQPGCCSDKWCSAGLSQPSAHNPTSSWYEVCVYPEIPQRSDDRFRPAESKIPHEEMESESDRHFHPSDGRAECCTCREHDETQNFCRQQPELRPLEASSKFPMAQCDACVADGRFCGKWGEKPENCSPSKRKETHGSYDSDKPPMISTVGQESPGFLVYRGIWTVVGPRNAAHPACRDNQSAANAFPPVPQAAPRNVTDTILQQCDVCCPFTTETAETQKHNTNVSLKSDVTKSVLTSPSPAQDRPYDLTSKQNTTNKKQSFCSYGVQAFNPNTHSPSKESPVLCSDYRTFRRYDTEWMEHGNKRQDLDTMSGVRMYTDMDTNQITKITQENSAVEVAPGKVITELTNRTFTTEMTHEHFSKETAPCPFSSETSGKGVTEMTSVKFKQEETPHQNRNAYVDTRQDFTQGDGHALQSHWFPSSIRYARSGSREQPSAAPQREPSRPERSRSHVRPAKRKRSRSRTFPCPLCSVACSNRGQLLGHLRTHTGERPFPCTEPGCSKTFVRNEELTRHRRIHSGDRPYSCSTCGKAFTRKDHLNKHVRVHDLDPTA